MTWRKILSTPGVPKHVDRHCSAPQLDTQGYHGRTVAARYYYACDTDCRLHAGELGHVYVISSNRDLSILQGLLHLLEPITLRGLHLPVDFFFRSLVKGQQVHSIGVILSDMASDGTLGIRAIKEKQVWYRIVKDSIWPSTTVWHEVPLTPA